MFEIDERSAPMELNNCQDHLFENSTQVRTRHPEEEQWPAAEYEIYSPTEMNGNGLMMSEIDERLAPVELDGNVSRPF